MKIIITLEVPEGTTVNTNAEPVYTPAAAFVDLLEPIDEPLPTGAMPIPGDPVPFRGAAQNPPQDAQCPVHRTAWQVKPAGVSKKTGKPYNAFWACPERMCDQKPSYAFIQAHPAA